MRYFVEIRENFGRLSCICSCIRFLKTLPGCRISSDKIGFCNYHYRIIMHAWMTLWRPHIVYCKVYIITVEKRVGDVLAFLCLWSWFLLYANSFHAGITFFFVVHVIFLLFKTVKNFLRMRYTFGRAALNGPNQIKRELSRNELIRWDGKWQDVSINFRYSFIAKMQ